MLRPITTGSRRLSATDCRRWAAFAETPDEHLPGGLYEPTQLKIYERFGWFIASWYWLAWRNVGHRMRWDKGFAVPSNIRQLSAEEQAKYGIWKPGKLTGLLS